MTEVLTIRNSNLTPLEILLVEDNPGDVRLILEVFKKARISNNINVATNGLVALSMIYKKGNYKNLPKPDLIILDLYLPKKNGWEILEEIIKDKDLKSIPVIILSSSIIQEDMNKHKSYSHLFITKPFEWEDYKNVLDLIEEFWFNYIENKNSKIPVIKPLKTSLSIN
ncbi:MAG: response regulator [Methanobacterium sp.]